MKKRIVLISILTLILIMNINIQFVYADELNLSNVLGKAGTFLSSGGSGAGDVEHNFEDIVKSLVSAGLAIGTIIAIAAGIVIGIKTMADGANGKKELKDALTPYIISTIVLFGGFTVWSAGVQILDSIITSSGSTTIVSTTTPGLNPLVETNVLGAESSSGGNIVNFITQLGAQKVNDSKYKIMAQEGSNALAVLQLNQNNKDSNGKKYIIQNNKEGEYYIINIVDG